MKYDNVFISLPTHAKRHVDKAIGDWKKLTNLTKGVPQLSDYVKHVTKSSETAPTHMLTRSIHEVLDPHQALAPFTVVNIAANSHWMHQTKSRLLTAATPCNGRFANGDMKSHIFVIPKPVRIL